MSLSRTVRIAAVVLACLGPWRGGASAQQAAGGNPPPAQAGSRAARVSAAAETLQAINDDYNRQLLQIERQRLARLVRLAASQAPAEAAETYEALFRLAIGNNLFADADPAADQVLRSTTPPPPVVRFLAEAINLIASADRGEYDKSLADLRRLVAAGAAKGRAAAPGSLLDPPSLLILCGAYYQRLAQGGRYDVARQAFELLEREADNPDVKQFCAHRLRQLNLIGKPAPPIRGTDVDRRPVDLDKLKGDVVLVVFWASWCLPNAAEVPWLDQVYEANRARGFRIIGINLDTLQNGGTRAEVVMPNVRRFLLEHNVRWPNLVNGEGPLDYASAFGVTEIPANVLIGRDGNVLQVDLSRNNLRDAVAGAVAR